MSDDTAEELKKNILSPSQWIRILFMAVYAVLCWILTFILPVIIILQILISLVTGRDNENLRKVGTQLSGQFHAMLNYLVYATDARPWPFDDGDAPEAGDDQGEDQSVNVDDKPSAATTAAPASAAPETETPPRPAAVTDDEDVFADISFTDNTHEDVDIATTGDDDDDSQGGDSDTDETKKD